MTPYEALVRGGHKHPQQILDDLAREGFVVVPTEKLEHAKDMAQTLKRFMDVK